MHSRDEVLEHKFGCVKVRNYTIAKGTERYHVTGCTSQHSFRVFSYCQWHFFILINGNDRWFLKDNTLTRYIHQRIRCAKIDTHIPRKGKATKKSHYPLCLSK